MPEEQVPTEETPESPDAAPDEGTPADAAPDAIDWEKRYADLQPEYTRAAQEAANYRRIFDAARQGDPEALQYLGWSAADDDDDDDELDPLERDVALMKDFLAQRLAREEQEEKAAQWQEYEDEHLTRQLAELEKKHGSIDDEDLKAAFLLAQTMRDQDGLPDLLGAYEFDSTRFEGKRKSWTQTKRSPQAPSGASGSHQPDMDDREQRRAWMLQRLQENDAA